MSQQTVVEGQKLVITRVFDAPVEKVYRAWADPSVLAKWFAPNERWRTPALDIETAAGGKHNITMRHSDGDEIQIFGKYVEIIPNSKLSFTWNMPAAGMGDAETLVTLEFRIVGAGTELTLTHDRLTDTSVLSETSQGWGGCLGRLDEYLVHGVTLIEPGQ